MSKLTITNDALVKLRAYIDGCEDEISGLGKVEEVEDGFELVDVVILKQTVTGATTNLDDDALGAFAYELQKSGDDISKWTCWWHSHAKMSTFFSGTDVKTIEESNEQRYLVSLVGNHAGTWKARLDIFEPAHATAELDVEVGSVFENEDDEQKFDEDVENYASELSDDWNVGVKLYAVVEPLKDKKIIELCENQIKTLVTKPAPTKWTNRITTRPRQTPLWEQNGLTLDEYNRTYHNLTKRERELLMKAEIDVLDDDEAVEIAHLADTLDNKRYSTYGKANDHFELGF